MVETTALLWKRHFWQKRFGAFSVSKSVIDKVVRYINNQEKHHHKKTFREKFTEFLKELDIDSDEKYLFFSEE